MFVKICGLTTIEGIAAAVEAEVDAVGFVFAESVRQLTPERALELSLGLSSDIVRVAVMLHPSPDYCKFVLDVFKPDWLQTDVKDFSNLEIPQNIRKLPVYRDTINLEHETSEYPDFFLFEGKQSGVGKLADWMHAANLARRSQLLLAGGLNAKNVADAIKNVQPWGVDVSTSVESSPGIKDPKKISEFVGAVREAETYAD